MWREQRLFELWRLWDTEIRRINPRARYIANSGGATGGLDMRTVGEHQGRPRTPETQGTIIGTIDISLGGDGVVADGSIKTAADLKGKVFAAEPNVYLPAASVTL